MRRTALKFMQAHKFLDTAPYDPMKMPCPQIFHECEVDWPGLSNDETPEGASRR